MGSDATTRVPTLYRVAAQTEVGIPAPTDTGQPESCSAWTAIIWLCSGIDTKKTRLACMCRRWGSGSYARLQILLQRHNHSDINESRQ